MIKRKTIETNKSRCLNETNVEREVEGTLLYEIDIGKRDAIIQF